MDYSIIIGSSVAFITGVLTVLIIFRKKIFNDLPTPNDKLAQQFYEMLTAKVDLKTLENSLEAIELERQRISIDMHDEMASQLGALLIDLEVVINDSSMLPLETAKILLEMRHNLKDSVSSLRNVIHGILPDRLKNETLTGAIESLCLKLDGEKGTSIFFRKGGRPSELSDQQKLYLYRIAQELLNNCFKHSRAWTIYVSVEWMEKELRINIRDTGVGVAALPGFLERDNKYGLTGIYARSLTIGATPKFSTSMSGTEFEITLPLK